MVFDYKTTLEAAKTAHQDLVQRRAEALAAFDAEIARLNRLIDLLESGPANSPQIPWSGHGGMLSLSALMATGDSSDIGLTQAVKAVLREAHAHGVSEMAPTEIRDRLLADQFDLSKYDNQMAAVHGVLRRVASEVATPTGKKYRLIPKKLNAKTQPRRENPPSSSELGPAQTGLPATDPLDKR